MVFASQSNDGLVSDASRAAPDRPLIPAPKPIEQPQGNLPQVDSLRVEHRNIAATKPPPEVPTELARVGGVGGFRPTPYIPPTPMPTPAPIVRPAPAPRLEPRQWQPGDPVPLGTGYGQLEPTPAPTEPETGVSGVSGAGGAGMGADSGRRQGGRGRELVEWMKKKFEELTGGASGSGEQNTQKAVGVGVMGVGAALMGVGGNMAIGGGAATVASGGLASAISIPAVATGVTMAVVGSVLLWLGGQIASRD